MAELLPLTLEGIAINTSRRTHAILANEGLVSAEDMDHYVDADALARTNLNQPPLDLAKAASAPVQVLSRDF